MIKQRKHTWKKLNVTLKTKRILTTIYPELTWVSLDPLVISLTRLTDCSMLLSKYNARNDFSNKSAAKRNLFKCFGA